MGSVWRVFWMALIALGFCLSSVGSAQDRFGIVLGSVMDLIGLEWLRSLWDPDWIDRIGLGSV